MPLKPDPSFIPVSLATETGARQQLVETIAVPSGRASDQTVATSRRGVPPGSNSRCVKRCFTTGLEQPYGRYECPSNLDPAITLVSLTTDDGMVFCYWVARTGPHAQRHWIFVDRDGVDYVGPPCPADAPAPTSDELREIANASP